MCVFTLRARAVSRILLGGIVMLPALVRAQDDPAASTVPPEPTGFFERPHLLGDPLGARSWLGEHGIAPEITLTQFYQGLVEGESERDSDAEYGGKGDLIIRVDGEKAGLWPGLFIESHGELRYGDVL